MRIACWIAKATDTNSEYVILTAFHVKKTHERTLMVRYTYIAFLLNVKSGGPYSEHEPG
jgi:hypothetical protein